MFSSVRRLTVCSGVHSKAEAFKTLRREFEHPGPKWLHSSVGVQNTILNPYWLWAPVSPEKVESSDLNSPVARLFSLPILSP